MKIVKNTAIILLWFCHTRMINIKPRPQRLQFLYYIPPIHCAWLIFRTLGDIKQRFQNLLRELWLSNCWASWSFSFRISKNLCIIPKMKKKKKLGESDSKYQYSQSRGIGIDNLIHIKGTTKADNNVFLQRHKYIFKWFLIKKKNVFKSFHKWIKNLVSQEVS